MNLESERGAERGAEQNSHTDYRGAIFTGIALLVVWSLAVVGVVFAPLAIFLSVAFDTDNGPRLEAAQTAAKAVSITSYILIAVVSLTQWARGRLFVSGAILLVLCLVPVTVFSLN